MHYSALKQRVCLVATLLSITILGSSFRSGKTDAKELPDSIRMAADSLNKYSIFSETYTLDPELRQSQENNYADWLRRHATPNQLAEIAKTSTSHNIRLWALRILLENPDKQIFDVLKEAVNDTTKDEQMSYRFLSNTPYNHRAFFLYYFDQENCQTPEMQEAIDSLAFFDYMRQYGYDPGIVLGFEPKQKYYAAAVEAADKGHTGILLFLVKYKNPNDRQRICKLLLSDFKKNGKLTDECCTALETWGNPDFDRYKNAKDLRRINKLLELSLKKNEEITELCHTALKIWEKPDFEWYAKAVCQTMASKKKYDKDPFSLPLLWSYPASWSYNLLEDRLSGKDQLYNKELTEHFLKRSAKRGPVPPVFQPLYDKYLKGLIKTKPN